MKTIQKIIMGDALGLALTTNLFAQMPPPPPWGTNSPPVSTNTIDWAAIVAAQQADYSNNYAPWFIQDIVISGGGPQQTGFAMQTQATSDLLTLSTNIAVAQAAQHAAVSGLLSNPTNLIPQIWTNTSGAVFFYDHTNEDGSAAVKVTFNIESAQTVGAQKL